MTTARNQTKTLPDTAPDVLAARAEYEAAVRAARSASRGNKRKKQFQMQARLHELLRAEIAANLQQKETNDERETDTHRETGLEGQGDFITRECGDDTNYRPLRR